MVESVLELVSASLLFIDAIKGIGNKNLMWYRV